MKREGIAVVDFGGQYANLIARRLRDLRVRTALFPNTIPPDALRGFKGIILSGGPDDVNRKGAPYCDEKIFSLGVPVLGLCYGHQLIVKVFGGKVASQSSREYGKKTVSIAGRTPLFSGLDKKEQVWFSHGDTVVRLPQGFRETASTGSAVAALENSAKKIFGLQFHPEVVGTPSGNRILSNFAFGICGCSKQRSSFDRDSLVAELKAKIGSSDKVVIGASGGVDSTVAAFLLREAVGKNLYCIFVDHGLLREGEVDEVRKSFKSFPHFRVVDASDYFLGRLAGVTDPEEKRKRIGHAFIKVFEEEAAKIRGAKWLAQGTIFSDRVESAATSGLASKIKSHHNLTLPEKMGLKLVEPLAELYKDEVRALGRKLGVPSAILKRHPFPGPGLAINIVGEVTEEKLEIVRKADKIFLDELRRAGWYDKVFEAFAAMISMRVVGVKGDARSYEYPVVLRCVDSKEVMTADWSKLPLPLLEKVSTRILNEVPGVNRVFYDISQKPPATIRYE